MHKSEKTKRVQDALNEVLDASNAICEFFKANGVSSAIGVVAMLHLLDTIEAMIGKEEMDKHREASKTLRDILRQNNIEGLAGELDVYTKKDLH